MKVTAKLGRKKGVKSTATNVGDSVAEKVESLNGLRSPTM